jgi:hypothetical protein
MAREVHKFAVTVPPGTPQNAPQLTNLTMPPREIVGVTVIVPPGPRGLMGFALAAAGQPIIPYKSGSYFVTDNEVIEWPLEQQITSGGWQLLAYNTGAFAHTLEIRFLANLPTDAAATATTLLPADQLSSPVVAVAPNAPDTPAPALNSSIPLAFVGFDPASVPPAPALPPLPTP